eukprot:3642823-Rhodomonas_salina.1
MAAGERRQAGGSERGLQRPGEVVKEGEGLGRDFGGGHDQWSEETGSMMSRAESEDVYGYAGSVRSSPVSQRCACACGLRGSDGDLGRSGGWERGVVGGFERAAAAEPL